jgi:peptide/nickel transport system substrate-binding protein
MITIRECSPLDDSADLNEKHSVLERMATRRAVVAGSAATAAAAVVGGHVAQVGAQGGARSSSPSGSNQDGNTLVYALGFDVDGTLDPQVTCYDSTIRVMLNVCEPLVWMPDATTIVPALAESWEVAPDGMSYTFKLKQGVTFHDGTPFNAAAVAYSYDRVVALDKFTAAAVAAGTPADAAAPPEGENIITPCQAHDQIGPYDHSEIIDDYTIKMVLTRPFAPFLTGLNGYLGIVSPTAVEAVGIAEFARKPIGTGPYMVEEWVEADHITLVKNPNYNWGSSFFSNAGAPFFDSIEYKVIPDGSVRTGTLISGETQYIDEIDPLQLEDLQSNSDLEVITKGQPGSGWIMFFNFERPGSPQEDIAVRQALAYAIDKDAFNQAVFGGINSPASSPLMKPTFAYEPQTESLYTYDAAKAAQMLDAAGWVLNGDTREKDGKKLEFYWSIQDRPNDKNIATFVQGAWREVGANVTVEAMERAAAQDKRKSGEYDLSFLWFSFADPDILRAIFHSSNIGNFNFARYTDADVDKWLEDAAASQDPEERKTLYSQVQMKVVQDAVTIPLADSITYNAKAKKLQGEYLDFLASYVWMNDAKFE